MRLPREGPPPFLKGKTPPQFRQVDRLKCRFRVMLCVTAIVRMDALVSRTR